MGEALKIGITGLPGAGKTYCLLKVIEMLEGDGLKVGGMITEPIVKRNRREGFYVMDWATKEKRVFASREITSKTMVGRYGVDISALEEVGVNALRGATANADDHRLRGDLARGEHAFLLRRPVHHVESFAPVSLDDRLRDHPADLEAVAFEHLDDLEKAVRLAGAGEARDPDLERLAHATHAASEICVAL